MTDDKLRDLDEQLVALGFTYSIASEQWLMSATATKDAEPVEWHGVLLAAPHLSLNNLKQIEDWHRLRARRANSSAPRKAAKKRAKGKSNRNNQVAR